MSELNLEAALEATLEDVRGLKRGRSIPVRSTEVFVPPDVDVAAIRATLELTQAQFAAQYGLSLSALRKWEQGTRRPEAAARTLLHLIKAAPRAVNDLLRKA